MHIHEYVRIIVFTWLFMHDIPKCFLGITYPYLCNHMASFGHINKLACASPSITRIPELVWMLEQCRLVPC